MPTSNPALADHTDPDLNRMAQIDAERLRRAVREAGGIARVAEVSGVPLGSLKRYLAGQEMKQGVLIALSDACGITIEWLAAGRGPMRPTDSPPVQVAAGRHLPLFSTIDMDRMARCLDAIDNAFGPIASRVPTRRKIQIATLLYDAMMDEKSDLNAFLNETIANAQDDKIT